MNTHMAITHLLTTHLLTHSLTHLPVLSLMMCRADRDAQHARSGLRLPPQSHNCESDSHTSQLTPHTPQESQTISVKSFDVGGKCHLGLGGLGIARVLGKEGATRGLGQFLIADMAGLAISCLGFAVNLMEQTPDAFI